MVSTVTASGTAAFGGAALAGLFKWGLDGFPSTGNEAAAGALAGLCILLTHVLRDVMRNNDSTQNPTTPTPNPGEQS